MRGYEGQDMTSYNTKKYHALSGTHIVLLACSGPRKSNWTYTLDSSGLLGLGRNLSILSL